MFHTLCYVLGHTGIFVIPCPPYLLLHDLRKEVLRSLKTYQSVLVEGYSNVGTSPVLFSSPVPVSVIARTCVTLDILV